MEKKINYEAARRGAEKIAGSNRGDVGTIITSLLASLSILTTFVGITSYNSGYRDGFAEATMRAAQQSAAAEQRRVVELIHEESGLNNPTPTETPRPYSPSGLENVSRE